nr:hypothetical protein [Candidatus Aminicenantes bacterium]NIQ72855.1 hypothetical protein [Candidatus Aminicenantes bacterium]NIT28877.1 hypothetical protein [Candidatus Aminicenantes bacterium]
GSLVNAYSLNYSGKLRLAPKKLFFGPTREIEAVKARYNRHFESHRGTTASSYTLDKKGNTTQRGTQQLAYDYRNQLVTANDTPSNTQVEMKYDVLGRRTQKAVTIGSQTKIENYYHSGHQVIEVRDENDQLLRQYIYGNGIDEILRMDKYENGTVTPYYYHTDASGSVTAITDVNGQLVERVTYDIYGMPTFWDAAGNKISKSSIGNNILFQGREYDSELNLYYFRARYYDPIMGRFLQTDPMGYADSMNLYQGFNMNPVNFTDPFGLETRQELYDNILDYYMEQASSYFPGEDDYQKRKEYFLSLIEEAKVTGMNEKQLQEHYYKLIGEKVEIEKEESFILLKKIWAAIKKGYNHLPGKAKEGGKRLWTKHLDERKEVEEEYKPVYGFLDERYKAGCEYVGETTGDIAESITEEVQLTVAVGVTAKGLEKAGNLKKVKNRKLWQINNYDQVKRWGNIKIFKDPKTGYWWSKDIAGHGGSAWKVFKETDKGLEWYRDANKYGDYLKGKHKGPVGMFIPWKELH